VTTAKNQTGAVKLSGDCLTGVTRVTIHCFFTPTLKKW